jgi:hypothetical protein
VCVRLLPLAVAAAVHMNRSGRVVYTYVCMYALFIQEPVSSSQYYCMTFNLLFDYVELCIATAVSRKLLSH